MTPVLAETCTYFEDYASTSFALMEGCFLTKADYLMPARSSTLNLIKSKGSKCDRLALNIVFWPLQFDCDVSRINPDRREQSYSDK